MCWREVCKKQGRALHLRRSLEDDAFVESGNAIKLEEVQHVDRDGNRVDDVTERFSYPVGK
jgi:hypothetical protein